MNTWPVPEGFIYMDYAYRVARPIPVEDAPASFEEARYMTQEYDEVFDFEVMETITDTDDGGTDIKFQFIILFNQFSGPDHNKTVWEYNGHVTRDLEESGIPHLKRDAAETFMEHITGKRTWKKKIIN